MRLSIIAGLIGSAAISLPVAAQSQSQQPGEAAQTSQQPAAIQQQTACGRLISELREMPVDERPVPLRQARAHRQSGNEAQCQRSLDQLAQNAQPGDAEAGQTGGQTGARTTASTGAGESGARIVVRQPPPQVTLQRGQPEIRIQQQQPTITVEMPPPKVTVRMPQPDVDVASSQQGRANVQVSGQAEPRVHFERAQPRVVVRQSQAQPQVTFQRAGEDQSRQSAQQRTQQGPSQRSDQAVAAQSDPRTTQRQSAQSSTAATSQATAVEVSRLLEMSVYDTSGQLLGDIERVIRNTRGELAVVIGHGGLLGMAEKQIRVPLQQAYMQGDRLIARGMTEESLDSMPEWSEPAGTIDIPESQSVRLTTNDA